MYIMYIYICYIYIYIDTCWIVIISINQQYLRYVFSAYNNSCNRNFMRKFPTIPSETIFSRHENPHGSNRTFLGRVWGIIYHNLEGFLFLLRQWPWIHMDAYMYICIYIYIIYIYIIYIYI